MRTQRPSQLAESNRYGTELAIVGTLTNFYFQDPISYSSRDPAVLANKFHEDLRNEIDPRLRNRVCMYVAAVFADICERAGVGEVCVVRGRFTNSFNITSVHHWNYDNRSGLYIDAMIADPVTFTDLPHGYKIVTPKLTSKQVLGVDLNSLDICGPS